MKHSLQKQMKNLQKEKGDPSHDSRYITKKI